MPGGAYQPGRKVPPSFCKSANSYLAEVSLVVLRCLSGTVIALVQVRT